MSFENHEGQRVPDVTFRTRVADQWVDVTTAELFAGKKVIVFSLPGAFTPTCSSTHLPRYEELYPMFRERGIDDVICVSVNDAFVMNAWAKDEEVEHVRVLGDGNGAFTEGMGMLVDKSDLGFGKRSWRYSMLVEDGVVTKMFIEPEVPGDPFDVSDADTMLRHIDPDAAEPQFFTLFTRPGCSHCARAKRHLGERNLPYEEILLGKDVTNRSLRAVSGAVTTPQVFVDGKHIGGADDLETYLGIVA